MSSFFKRCCLAILLVLLPLMAVSEAQTIKMLPFTKPVDSPSASAGEESSSRLSSIPTLSSVYDGRWKGSALTATKTDRNTETMSLNIKSGESGFSGTGVLGQNHIFEVHGYVEAGKLTFKIPRNELDSQCSGWDITLRGSLDKNLTVMTLTASGTVCGDGGGQDGDFSAVLTKKFSTDNSLKSIVYSGKKYVAVGDEGTLITSDDAITWSKQVSVATIWDVSFGEGHFVAVGDGGRILTSEDGLKWVRRYSGTTGALYCIAHGNEMFVAAGSLGQIINSSDGISWNKPIRPTGTTFRKLIFTNNQFIAIGDDNKIYFSARGIAWKKMDLGTDAYNADSFFGMASGNGQLVVVGTSARNIESAILTSSDFTSWKRRTIDLAESLFDIAYGNNMFVAVGYDGAIYSSRDGSGWILRRLGTNDLRGVTFGDGHFVVVGDNNAILVSVDGISWPLPSSGTRNTLNNVAYGAGKYVAVGEYGTVLSSVDGDSWTYRTTNVTSELKKIVFGNDSFVAIGRDSILTSSTAEGVTWENYFNNNTGSLSDIAFGNGVFVGIGGFGRLLKSVDGKVWQKQKLDGRVRLRNIIFVEGKFLLIGRDLLFESVNGSNWQQVSSNNRILASSITVGNSLLVGVGDYGSIETSSVESAHRWSVQYSGTTNSLKNCAYGNGVFVAVGEQGTILTSEDGEEWLSQMSVTGNTLNALVFGNEQFVAVGRSGTILTSQDGESWSEQTPVTELEIKEIEQPLL